MLAKWQPELLKVVVPHLREQMQAELPAQWETAGYVGFAGDGTRGALARSASLEATGAPVRRQPKARHRKAPAARRRAPTTPAAAARQKKATSPQLWRPAGMAGGQWLALGVAAGAGGRQ